MPAGDDAPRPRPLDDPARLADLRSSGLADSPPEEAFDRFTRTVARALGVPVALVSLVDDGRQFFKSQLGLPEPYATQRETPLSHSFCRHVVRGDAPFVVTDARADDRVRGSDAIGDLGVVGYAGVPVHGRSGEPIGALCAITHEPRAWREDEVQLLQDLAAAATDVIALRAAAAEQRTAVADLSHHLRSGLTALQLEAAELEADAQDESRRGRASRLSEALRVQVDVVDDLLGDAAAADLGHERAVDLGALLQAAAARAGAATERVVEVVQGPPVSLVVPEPEVVRLVDDVLALLLEHGRGDVRLQVLDGPAAVRVRASDDSAGLPPDVMARVTGRRDGSAATDASLAERAASCGGRLVQTSSRPTTLDLLLPRR